MKKLMFAAAMAAAMTASAELTTVTFNVSSLSESIQAAHEHSGRVYFIYSPNACSSPSTADNYLIGILNAVTTMAGKSDFAPDDLKEFTWGANNQYTAKTIAMTYIDEKGNIDVETFRRQLSGNSFQVEGESYFYGSVMLGVNESGKNQLRIANWTAQKSSSMTLYDGILNGSDDRKIVVGIADVPEPTSALLMLLGMAGLALKRKVA